VRQTAINWIGPHWIVPVKKLVTSNSTSEWCHLPYQDHPRGCPMFGKKGVCPPNARHVSERFDLSKSLYLVHSEFNLLEDIERRRKNNSTATERQLRCVLYWQSKSRKQLEERTRWAVSALDLTEFTYCPEAMGVNVFATARISGLHLDKTRRVKICRHVALIGHGL